MVQETPQSVFTAAAGSLLKAFDILRVTKDGRPTIRGLIAFDYVNEIDDHVETLAAARATLGHLVRRVSSGCATSGTRGKSTHGLERRRNGRLGRELLGGRCRSAMTSAASLSQEVREWITMTLRILLGDYYGSTEAGSSLSLPGR